LDQIGDTFFEEDAVDAGVVRVVFRYVDCCDGGAVVEGVVADGCDAGGDGDGGDFVAAGEGVFTNGGDAVGDGVVTGERGRALDQCSKVC